MAFMLLFLLGIYLGKISNENKVVIGIKMLLAGVVAGLLSVAFSFVA